MNDFTDPADAIHEAAWQAQERGVAYAVVALSTTLLRVLPLYNAGDMNVLEVCRP